MSIQELSQRISRITENADTLYNAISVQEVRDAINTLESIESAIEDWESDLHSLQEEIEVLSITIERMNEEEQAKESITLFPLTEAGIKELQGEIKAIFTWASDEKSKFGMSDQQIQFNTDTRLAQLRDAHMGMFWQALAMMMIDVVWSEERLIKQFIANGGHFDSMEVSK